MAVQANKYGRYPCHCCQYYTFREPPLGEYSICPVCYWEDDPWQLAAPALTEGANHVSLLQAQANFAQQGVSDQHYKPYAKRLNAEELPD